MDSIKYSCIFKNKSYTIYLTKFHTFLKPIGITVLNGINRIQSFTYIHNHKTIVSFTSPQLPYETIQVYYAFLTYVKYELPDFPVDSIPVLEFHRNGSESSKDTILFSTHVHTFRAQVVEEPYHYSVKIGGKEFVGCVELFVYKPESPFGTASRLAQIYSEPECWYNLEKKGNIVDLIKGSLQLCQMLFGVNVFYFNDTSNIECGIGFDTKTPPRKIDKPFSLAHLSIALRGKTWYETHFNAFIKDTDKRELYNESLKNLNHAQKHDFETFAAINFLTRSQYDYLKPIYETSTSWREFFNRIPKQKQCEALYNWLSDYIDKHILHFQPTKYEWCIFLGNMSIGMYETKEIYPKMIRTDLFIEMDTLHTRRFGGGGGTRHKSKKHKRSTTHKQKIFVYNFSNERY